MEKYFEQPSVMSAQEHFSQVPAAEIERSRFDRSHAVKTTFDAGKLIPFFVDEVLPGDTFDINSTAFARLATPLKPIMDNIYLDTHFFFVPYRLIWDHWENFCGERDNPEDDPEVYTIPTTNINLGNIGPEHLANYFGIPRRPGVGVVQVSALPFRAYHLIWNEWYRDQNLQQRVAISKGDGPDLTWDGSLPARRGKRHDYFTSCLPWPQKGDAVEIPLGSYAPVRGIGFGTANPTSGPINVRETGGATVNYPYAGVTNASNLFYINTTTALGATANPEVWADLSQATAFTINDLRTAFQIQRLLERDARSGTRYIEIILSQFGVRSDDARLQRPEYLGGGSTRLNVNPIASTAYTTQAPQANLAGIGTAVGRASVNKSFTEHGIVIGLISARADLTYQQGLERFWSRRTRYDFYWPALAHLGEQPVYNKEIFIQGTAADNQVFGYQERYAEYRYKQSRITGLFNSEQTSPLDVWHLAQDFAALPVLNASFIQEDPPIDRVIAVPAEPHFLADFWIEFKTDRPMPVYGVPGLIDHF